MQSFAHKQEAIINDFNQILKSLSGKFSNKNIVNIYNKYNENRALIINSVQDQNLQYQLEEVFEILDKKARTNVRGINVVSETDVNSLEPTTLDSVKDTLEAIANFFIQVLTIGCVPGFDRHEYADKMKFIKTKESLEKYAKNKKTNH